ncbi:hypothetical protein [Sphingomonas sp. Leaf343]|uniref:hypothetical protein n=1 Tax=Sphingomonas sp. Leaf343 TaxID=1736345 RepID=UPI0006FB9012|nr:hypothetical protein [Sphingomonas sp. Leaf343]KQR82205.1 hypothetical protein ASG07_11010 [Sphingomonas sp. Leaf343]
MIAPRNCRDHGVDITAPARFFATQDRAAADAVIGALIAEAVANWLLDDATFWQRVRFRSRQLRAQTGPRGTKGELRFC